MGILIDTSIFIESERGRLDLEGRITARGGEDIFMSVITASELLHGVHRSRREFRSARAATVEAWIEQFELLDIDLPTARIHARIFAELKSAGNIIGPHDLWLAASCLSRGLSIITANVREFSRVRDLSVEDWTTRIN